MQIALQEALSAGQNYTTGWRGREARDCIVDYQGDDAGKFGAKVFGRFLAGLEGGVLLEATSSNVDCWGHLQKLRWRCLPYGCVTSDLILEFDSYYSEAFCLNGQAHHNVDHLLEVKLRLLEANGTPSRFLRLATTLNSKGAATWLIVERGFACRREWDPLSFLYQPRPFIVSGIEDEQRCTSATGLFAALQAVSKDIPSEGRAGLPQILSTIKRLRKLGRETTDLTSLGSKLELHLMSRIEQFPYPYFHPRGPRQNRSRPTYYYSRYLSFLARDAEHFIPLCQSPAQKALALGVAIVLENGLRALSCFAPEAD